MKRNRTSEHMQNESAWQLFKPWDGTDAILLIGFNSFFSPCVGDYDVEAIKYGYMDADESTLDEIARDAVDRGLHFATDEDGPGLDG
mmetsp:Transcript_39647/g.157660  ORF Transcript_39647/g.157660 Transcript_39647/m.157660 type:complete len:87 (-) Transcript_39647:1038-1298(-)